MRNEDVEDKLLEWKYVAGNKWYQGLGVYADETGIMLLESQSATAEGTIVWYGTSRSAPVFRPWHRIKWVRPIEKLAKRGWHG